MPIHPASPEPSRVHPAADERPGNGAAEAAVCPACGGSGLLDDRTCPECDGTGRLNPPQHET